MASPKITGTSSSAAVDRNRLFSSRSITATSYPAAVRSPTTRLPKEPSPTTMMWSRRWRARRTPADCRTRRDSSKSATKATSSAVVVTPANIRPTAKMRSHADCWAKVNSPYPTVVMVSAVKYIASSQDSRGFV